VTYHFNVNGVTRHIHTACVQCPASSAALMSAVMMASCTVLSMGIHCNVQHACTMCTVQCAAYTADTGSCTACSIMHDSRILVDAHS
jgi:hypothetical protein